MLRTSRSLLLRATVQSDAKRLDTKGLKATRENDGILKPEDEVPRPHARPGSTASQPSRRHSLCPQHRYAAHLSPTTVGNWLNGARIPSSIDSLLAVIRCLREEAQRGERLTGEMRTLLDEERWREDYEDLRRAYAEDSREAAYRLRARAGDLRGETRTGRTITADITDFTALIDERTAEFVGRRRFIERLWSTLDDSSLRSGYLLVHGEPGIGKTALLAKLVRDRKFVHHFNSTLVGITSRERFLRNVCAQLILRFNLPHSRLPEDATSDSSFLVSLLVRAAEQERIVVAVDAIDEAVQDGNGQNRLFLPPALPPGVFFIVTMRDPDDIDLYVDEPRELPLLENNVENQADVEDTSPDS